MLLKTSCYYDAMTTRLKSYFISVSTLLIESASQLTFNMNFLNSPHCSLTQRAMSSVIKIPVLKP